MMKMALPKEILEWVDDNRCSISRQAFIISILFKLKQDPINYNTTGLVDEIHTNRKEASCGKTER